MSEFAPHPPSGVVKQSNTIWCGTLSTSLMSPDGDVTVVASGNNNPLAGHPYGCLFTKLRYTTKKKRKSGHSYRGY